MNILFENELDIILRISFWVLDKIKVVQTSHNIAFEFLKFMIDFLFELFEGHIKLNMIKPKNMINLIAVDKLRKAGLFLCRHGYSDIDIRDKVTIN